MSHILFCCAPHTPVLLSPTATSQLETELRYGQGFICHETVGEFIRGDVVPLIAHPSGPISTGYVNVKDLGDIADDAAYKVTALKAPVFSQQNIKSRIKMILPFGAYLQKFSVLKDSEFIHIGQEQYVHRHHIAPLGDYEPDFTFTAERHIGLPYIWGGISSEGLDCSGLVQTALWAAGLPCPRNSGEQCIDLGQAIDLDAPLKRGDLVFWKGHVGIMQSEKYILHANGHHMLTISEPLNVAAQRIDKSTGPIIAIKRL